MAALPEPRQSTVAAIYAWHESKPEQRRAYFGISSAGEPCLRKAWLSFRWARAEKFDGRMIRLFQTGQLAEARFAEELKAIGVELHTVDELGEQFAVEAISGHLRGHSDAIGRGFPEAPKAWALVEMKSHNDKSFKDLVKKGVITSKPVHYDQMTLYCGLNQLDRMAYLAFNKNTDEIHFEWLHFDAAHYASLLKRSETIIYAPEPLPRISDDASSFLCKFCHFHPICHGTDVPEVSCRTCAHVTPSSANADWICSLRDKAVSTQEQITGCGEHRFIPSLLGNFADPIDADTRTYAIKFYNKLNKREFVNGSAPGELSSREIQAAADKSALGDDVTQSLRNEFDATVVG